MNDSIIVAKNIYFKKDCQPFIALHSNI